MQFKSLLRPGAVILSLGAMALPAFAQDTTAPVEVPANSVFIFNTFLFLIMGFLVMWMAAGFGMLEAGLVRSKNVSMQLTKNIVLFAIAAIMYYLIGYNLMYPGDGWTIQNVLGAFSLTSLEPVGVAPDAVGDISYASVGSDFYFQLMFCATTASIVSGTLAERMKLWPFLIFTVILTGVLYPIVGSWKWGGGFLAETYSFQDFAGSTLVHSVGGWAALTGAIILGARKGKFGSDGTVHPMPGSNMPLVVLGTFILWLGWFGFNGGSQLAAGSVGDIADVSRIFANTNTAAAGGVIAVLILMQILYKKVDITMICNGALAGLVSITAEPLYPSLGWATLVGAVGGVIVVIVVPLLDKLKLDDVVGAIPVHLCAGIWGTLIVAATNPESTFFGQLISVIIIGIFMVVASGIVWLILNGLMGLRVSEEEEMDGLDKGEIGVEAYPEFSKI